MRVGMQNYSLTCLKPGVGKGRKERRGDGCKVPVTLWPRESGRSRTAGNELAVHELIPARHRLVVAWTCKWREIICTLIVTPIYRLEAAAK